jgi:1-acyl-sn-glycerol-3-phosphate acyltransferase
MLSRLYAHTAAFCKAARCVAHLLRGMLTITRFFGKATAQQRAQHIAQWAHGFLRILGVQVRTTGSAVTTGPLLVVANHVSWLDILVMLAVQPVRFVSKADVKYWPLIGWLATNAGTLYIERASRRDALRVVHHIAEALREAPAGTPVHAASIIAVFPEGTTGDGTVVLPFHANLVQAAISAHAPVQPVALRYQDAATGALSLVPAYVDDDTLVSSVWRLLASAPVQAVVHFSSVQHADGRDRRAWALDLRGEVAQSLKSP